VPIADRHQQGRRRAEPRDRAGSPRVIAVEVTAELQESTPVDTGFARASWIPSVGAPSTELGGALDAPNPAAAEAGSLASPAFKLSDGMAYVSNNARYIRMLDEGSSLQAPAGFVRASIERGLEAASSTLDSSPTLRSLRCARDRGSVIRDEHAHREEDRLSRVHDGVGRDDADRDRQRVVAGAGSPWVRLSMRENSSVQLTMGSPGTRSSSAAARCACRSSRPPTRARASSSISRSKCAMCSRASR
jgi:hypothetical protein